MNLYFNFQGKYCNLIKKDGFKLNGTVEMVTDEQILFRSKQTTSVIAVDQIASLTELKRRE